MLLRARICWGLWAEGFLFDVISYRLRSLKRSKMSWALDLAGPWSEECVRTQWGHNESQVVSVVTSRDTSHTQKYSERYYFCVTLRSGHFMSVCDSWQKVRVPRDVFFESSRNHSSPNHDTTCCSCVHPREVTQNKHVQHTRTLSQ